MADTIYRITSDELLHLLTEGKAQMQISFKLGNDAVHVETQEVAICERVLEPYKTWNLLRPFSELELGFISRACKAAARLSTGDDTTFIMIAAKLDSLLAGDTLTTGVCRDVARQCMPPSNLSAE